MRMNNKQGKLYFAGTYERTGNLLPLAISGEFPLCKVVLLNHCGGIMCVCVCVCMCREKYTVQPI